jgi:hypothetical protein
MQIFKENKNEIRLPQQPQQPYICRYGRSSRIYADIYKKREIRLPQQPQ